MKTNVYFVVAVDADPDPVDSPYSGNDTMVLKKYHSSMDIVKNMCQGKGAICVHTSSRYRTRFLKSPFIEFWQQWIDEGGALVLHPEEDLYATPETRLEGGTYYNDPKYMENIISDTVDIMKRNHLEFTAFRGAFFGFTQHIFDILIKQQISIDLSCAPGVVLSEQSPEWSSAVQASDWSNAPASGYYMSEKSYRKPARQNEKRTMFEIPVGWDGKDTKLSQNYLINEVSTYKKMCKTWDAIVQRSINLGSPQFIQFVFHASQMSNKKYRHRCERTLEYMEAHNGIPVTPNETKNLFDENEVKGSDSV